MTYDEANDRVLVFGGQDEDSDPLDDVWAWDGSEWDELSGSAPPARAAHAMVYDAAAEGVVVFGGTNEQGEPLGDTWVLEGGDWEQLSPAEELPGPRDFHAMAYDAARDAVVLFGGLDEEGEPLGDTWVLAGGDWEEIESEPPPAARRGHAMAFDAGSGAVVLQGGLEDGASEPSGETWTWDGSAWSSASPGTSPPERRSHAMVYDHARGEVLAFGGSDGDGALDDLWAWDGGDWRDATPAVDPAPRREHAMVYDAGRERIVLFGGGQVVFSEFGDTWEWDGDVWRDVTPDGESPQARAGHAMVYDSDKERVLLFGGAEGFDNYLGDTWEWDGDAWYDVTPDGESPPARATRMVYDRARGEAVLFGGYDGDEVLGDTWTWDGSEWEDVTPRIESPPELTMHAMAYDEGRGVTVLFGGRNDDAGWFEDVWEWDGEAWAERPPSGDTPISDILGGPGMTYDSTRDLVLLFDDWFDDVFEWDGDTWAREHAPAAEYPRDREVYTIAYDAAREGILLFGGRDSRSEDELLGDTWFFRPE